MTTKRTLTALAGLAAGLALLAGCTTANPTPSGTRQINHRETENS